MLNNFLEELVGSKCSPVFFIAKNGTERNSQYPDIKVSIEGHTDNTGKAKSNQKLSEKRAEAVKTYLVSMEISADRLATVGHGSDMPIKCDNWEMW